MCFFFQLDISQRDWLRNSGWHPDKDNVILVHGYGGGEDALPMSVLKDGNSADLLHPLFISYIIYFNIFSPSILKAYVNHGDFNVFMVDWGALCQPPCYVAAVHNLKPVAKCLSFNFAFLRNSGMPVQRTLCVGHSLGAHICGLMSNYLDFRIERIIGKCFLNFFLALFSSFQPETLRFLFLNHQHWTLHVH